LRALLAVNPFAPTVQPAARLWGYDGSSPPRKKCRHALQGNLYTLPTQRKEELLSRVTEVNPAPRGPVAGTVDLVKTYPTQSIVI